MLMCKMQSHLKAFTNIYTLKLLKILGHKIIIMNDMRMNHSLHIGTYVEYDIVYRVDGECLAMEVTYCMFMQHIHV